MSVISESVEAVRPVRNSSLNPRASNVWIIPDRRRPRVSCFIKLYFVSMNLTRQNVYAILDTILFFRNFFILLVFYNRISDVVYNLFL